MFKNLSSKITESISKLRDTGITGSDIESVARDVTNILLDSDVAFSVVKDLTSKLRERALDKVAVKGVSNKQAIISIMNDLIVEILGEEDVEINTKVTKPAVIMLVGLQGAGKTTVAAKIAHLLKTKQEKNPLLASLDLSRPAAREQLSILANDNNIDALPCDIDKSVEKLTDLAIAQAKENNNDVVILDTAGRLHTDNQLMKELKSIKKKAGPVEILLVVDSLIGQDAINIAESFHEAINITGLILTKIDSDTRGGAALSLRQVTSCPIKLLSVGEHISDIEVFDAKRIAERILGMGDIVSLVEKAQELSDEKKAQKMMERMEKGKFNFNDMMRQLTLSDKMGGVEKIVSMLPGGAGGLKDKIGDLPNPDGQVKKFKAIIYSMTKDERRNPKKLNASRWSRIRKGSGVAQSDIKVFLNGYQKSLKMIKKMSKLRKQGVNLESLAQQFLG